MTKLIIFRIRETTKKFRPRRSQHNLDSVEQISPLNTQSNLFHATILQRRRHLNETSIS